MNVDAVVEAVRDAQGRLFESVAGLSEDEVRAPSMLPGWSRAHVLTHLARNADSNTWMLDGARVGESREQYPGGLTTRSAAIEAGAARALVDVLDDLAHTSERLLAAYGRMDDASWDAFTRPTSSAMPARAGAFSRLREVEVHHVDLALGYSVADWPAWFVETEIDRRTASLGGRLTPGTALHLEATDTGASWDGGEGATRPSVSGPACWLLAWLLGRDVPAGTLVAPGGIPGLGAW